MTQRGISVVVPVYNNAPTLPELCERVRAALPGRTVELVLVDDGSTDDSWMAIGRLGVRGVLHPRNRGQNAAIVTGLTVAAQPVVCVLDADLEDLPEAIPCLVQPVESGRATVAFASRGTHATRRLSSRLFRWLLRRLFPSLPEHAGLWFAIDRQGLAALLEVARDDDYLPAVIGALRLPSLQVATGRGSRPVQAGPGAYGGLKRLRYAARALRAALRVKMRLR